MYRYRKASFPMIVVRISKLFLRRKWEAAKFNFMLYKKLRVALITSILVCSRIYTVSAQDTWDIQSSEPTAYKSVIHQAFGKVSFDMYCKVGSWGYGQQFYPANFHNQTFYKIHVKGEYVAVLTCGNESISQMDFTCDKYSDIITVDETEQAFPYSQPQHFGTDQTGLAAYAEAKSCTGTAITARIRSGITIKTRDRIKALQIRNLKLYAVQDDGSEVPVTNEGVLISQPAPTANNNPNTQTGGVNMQANATGNTLAQNSTPYHTAMNANDPKGNTGNNTNYATQEQTQQYINNAQDPNNDAIQSSLALNQAKVNAMKPGGANANQRQQIAQVQQQQQADNSAAMDQSINDLGNAIGNLLTKKTQSANNESTPAPATYESTTDLKIEERNQSDANNADEYRENLAKLGKYAQVRRIYLTPDLLNKQDNRTQKETMDFIAKTIWQYSKTKDFRLYMFIGNIIDEIAFADSIFYYRCHHGVQNPYDPNWQAHEQFKIDLNKTPVTYFEVEPGDDVAHYDVFLNIATDNPNEKLAFHLTADAASQDIPAQIITAFIHLISFCRNNSLATTKTAGNSTANNKQPCPFYFTVLSNNDKTVNYNVGVYHVCHIDHLSANDGSPCTRIRAGIINNASGNLEWKDYKVRIQLKSGKHYDSYATLEANGDTAGNHTIAAGQSYYPYYCFHAPFSSDDIDKMWLVLNDEKTFELTYSNDK